MANAWLNKLNDNFFKTSKAILPLALPQFIKKCGPNNEIIMSVNDVPENTQIEWYNGNYDLIGKDKTKQLFTPGKYFLRTVDPKGNIFLVPYFQVRNLPVPSKPSIIASSLTTICSGLSVNLSTSENIGKVLWNTGSTLTTIEAKNQGDYKAKTLNKFECSSDFSTSIKVTVDHPSDKEILAYARKFFYKADQML